MSLIKSCDSHFQLDKNHQNVTKFYKWSGYFFSCCRVSNKKENINSNKKLYISYRKESLEKSISNYLILLLLTICYQNDSTISLVDITFSSRKENKVYYHLVFFVE